MPLPTELTVTGEQLVGKGIRMGADYVDTSMAKGTETLLKRPSTYINILAGLGGVLGYAMLKTSPKATRDAMLIIGSNILAEKIPDYLVEQFAPTSLPKTSYGVVSASGARGGVSVYRQPGIVSVTPMGGAVPTTSAGFF